MFSLTFWKDVTGPVKQETDDFNHALAQNREQRLLFKPAQKMVKNDFDLCSNLLGPALLTISARRSFKWIYITCAIIFIVTLPFIIRFILFGAGINAIGGLGVPYTLSILLAPTCLIFGIPAFFKSKKTLTFFQKGFEIGRLNRLGKYVTVEHFLYANLQHIDIGYISRADSDASTRTDWGLILKLKNTAGKTESLKFCEFDYHELEKRMLFWLRNLVWQ